MIHNSANCIIKRIYVHAYADTGQQCACTGAGSVVHLKLISCVYVDSICRQLTAQNTAGNIGINIVHRNTAGYTATEQTGCHAHGNQRSFQPCFVGSTNGKIRL